jgi:hypothetical protein
VARAVRPNLVVNSPDDGYDPTNDFDSVNGGCKPAPQHGSLPDAMMDAPIGSGVISFDPSMTGKTINFADMGCSNCSGGVIYNGIGSWMTFTNSIFSNNMLSLAAEPLPVREI